MADLEYSSDALNAKSAFYRSQAIVYVEGEDDVLFWDEIFKRLPEFNATIESVGGCKELDKYIEKIESGELNAIAARDSDFLKFQKLNSNHTRVIYTFGYSMENSLYTSSVIHHTIRSWCKTSNLDEAECESWLNELELNFAPLIKMDIANAVSSSGIPVLSDNCSRYMTSRTSSKPCPYKITEFFNSIEKQIPTGAVQEVEQALHIDGKPIINNLRGHFLASAVSKYIAQTGKSLGKKFSISADSLYATAISHFTRVFTQTHPHYTYYETATKQAASTF